MRVLEPASLPDGFTVRNIAVVNRWPNPSYVELVYSDGEHAFTLRLETTSAKLGTVYGTSFVKALEVPNNPDMFGVSDEGRFIAYYRRTPRRGYDIFMGPPDHPLTHEEALKVLISLPSR